MKIIAKAFFLCFLLSGCGTTAYQKSSDFSSASTLQQKRDVLIKWLPYNGMYQNFPKIRNELIEVGGEDNTFLNGLILECYNNRNDECTYYYYINAIREYNDKKCEANPSCLKERNLSEAINKLNSTYYLIMARNQYHQSEFDLIIRELCKSAGIGQRGGISLMQIENDVNQASGLSPEVRGQFRDIAMTCWRLSEYGVEDGTTKIKNLY
ncbi:hypothetical protein FHC77_07005 [Atlantibacter hermannii]|uniref:hypothetical protein n=1 Tax=Atlantibacter hermannii TaxID=565 RepID=UPI001C7042EF|nr:hypothetical protein [Atlantibacter hermannii]MBW9430494.1 hypothetical protein [Atlantibacter hermannii]